MGIEQIQGPKQGVTARFQFNWSQTLKISRIGRGGGERHCIPPLLSLTDRMRYRPLRKLRKRFCQFDPGPG
jgi:hypothetical protein